MSKAIPKLRFKEFTDQWHVNALAPNIDILSGVPIKSEDISEDENGVPILRGINITEGSIRHSKDIDRYYLNGIEELTKFLVDEGDLVIGMDGSKVGKNVSLVSKKESGSLLIQRVARIRSKSSSDIRFIYQHIFSPRFHRYVDEVNTSSGIPHISLKQINEFEIGFPSLPEQQKIASFLSEVDEKIQQLTRKKELLEQYKKGVMQQLFCLHYDSSDSGDGHDGTSNQGNQKNHSKSQFRQLRFKDEHGKAYPKWEEKRLGDVSVFLDGRRKPIKSEDRSKMKGEYPYYGASGIIDYVNEYIFDEDIILLGEDGENIISRNLPLAFRVSGKCWVNNHAHVIKPNADVDIDFLTHTLERVDYVVYNTGTAQPKLNQEVCRNIKLLFPMLKEQQKIANFLSAIDTKIESVATQIEKTQTFKKGLLQQMFV